MKKISSYILLCAMLLLALTGCGKKTVNPTPSPIIDSTKKPEVTTPATNDLMPDYEDGKVKDNDGIIGDDKDDILDKDGKGALDKIEDNVEEDVNKAKNKTENALDNVEDKVENGVKKAESDVKKAVS